MRGMTKIKKKKRQEWCGSMKSLISGSVGLNGTEYIVPSDGSILDSNYEFTKLTIHLISNPKKRKENYDSLFQRTHVNKIFASSALDNELSFVFFFLNC